MSRGWLLVCVIVCTCLFGAGEVVGQSSEVVVTGSGAASVMPDKVTIGFGIVTTGNTSNEAAELNAGKYDVLISILNDNGFDRKKVFTERYWVDAQRHTKKRDKITGYVAQHNLHYSTRDLEIVGKFIEVITQGGATVRGITYKSTKVDSLRRVALSDAVRNARADADAMALAAQGSLGSLIELTTHYPDNPSFRSGALTANALSVSGVKLPSLAITPNKLNVTVTVLGKWKFVPCEE